ncbi:MAG: catechol 2,3-dioxygenase [Solirubrobacteraceae bacterium]|jgi:catechol 2,3-dioxygenase|nr:catechol 2,3-dioxygenase [Solirubrobacteraceae bacterium]
MAAEAPDPLRPLTRPLPLAPGAGLGPSVRLGPVTLVVSNLRRALSFYAGFLGLWMHRVDEGTAALGAGDEDLVLLVEDPDAPPAIDCTGLFHLALLVPSRRELAHSLQRLIYARMPLTGFADHLVCESIYLNDPDGNGIEIYADRPPEEWPLDDGHVQMATDPLDLYYVLTSATGRSLPPEQLEVGTVIGHVHLRVADTDAAEAFYRDAIGLDVMARWERSSVLAAGGYHHHIGVNHAASAGAPPAPPWALGMRQFELVVADLDSVRARLGPEAERADGGLDAVDPSGNRILVRAG